MSLPRTHSFGGGKGRGDGVDVCSPEVPPNAVEKPNNLPPPPQAPRPIRHPLRRTRQEEYKAYGRTFIGSGQHDDYDAMTKLGEGTFGHVLFLSTHS
jgi:hypothetical protein